MAPSQPASDLREGGPCASGSRDPRVIPAASRSRRGASLVLVLLLVGVVSVLTLHAQMSSASALRRARLEATRAMLRAAASDAAWIALKNAPSGGPTNAIGLPVRRRLPSGAELETRINPQPEELARYAQAIARLTGGGADPGVWAIEVTASSSNVSERVGCYYRPQGGSKEVLGWYED